MDDGSIKKFPEYDSYDLSDLAKELRTTQAQLEEFRKDAAALQGRVDYLRDVLLPGALDKMGLTSANVENVGRVSLTHDLYASIKVEDRAAAFEWLRSTGNESLIVETVNAQTLRAWAKEQIRNGKEIAPTIGIRAFTRASLTKA